MKVLKSIPFVFITLFLISCSNNSESEVIEPQETDFIYNLTGDKNLTPEAYIALTNERGTTIQCVGSCGCHLVQIIGTNTVTCDCSDCSLEIISGQKNMFGDFKMLASPFFKEAMTTFNDYIEENYKMSSVVIEKIEMNFTKDQTGIMILDFIDGEQNLQSILIGYNRTETWVVKCTGTCGCRPQFDMGTGTASCSCSECELTIIHQQ